jgi:outer membrane protein OmpA-like peptidoglycan-associated protein
MLGVLILMGMVTLSGCATRKYVRQEAGNVESKLDTKINETNTKVTETGERIDAVDRRAQQGIQAADSKATQAQQTASAADQKATNAQRTADGANQAVQQANNRITTVEREIAGMDQYTAAGPASTVTFKNGSSVLSAEAKKTLDDVANQVSNMKGGYMLEVQGYTDSRGSESFNNGLSDRRAEAVKRYLVTKNVQLMRISIVGEGKSNPVADNKTAKGRAENRRVEIRILKNAAAGRATN